MFLLFNIHLLIFPIVFFSFIPSHSSPPDGKWPTSTRTNLLLLPNRFLDWILLSTRSMPYIPSGSFVHRLLLLTKSNLVIGLLPVAHFHFSRFVLFLCVALTRLALSSTPASPSAPPFNVVSLPIAKHPSSLPPGEANCKKCLNEHTHLRTNFHCGLLLSTAAYRSRFSVQMNCR